ncbi:unnamed protein product [Linum trigynum]|uniref:Uncharacterized protein n=1 Tax=Linum trigynum TaxID=586398 RepID=A0AAV2CTM7_9ROSI
MTVSEENPPKPNGAGTQRDGGAVIADLLHRLVWPRKIRDFRFTSAPEIPVLLSGILGKKSRVNFQNCVPRRKFPNPFTTLLEECRLILGNAGARPYKTSPLLANQSLCSERNTEHSAEKNLAHPPDQQLSDSDLRLGIGPLPSLSSAGFLVIGCPVLRVRPSRPIDVGASQELLALGSLPSWPVGIRLSPLMPTGVSAVQGNPQIPLSPA